MQTFMGVIRDERYSTPTLMIVAAQGEARARAIVQQNLGENPRHLSIELRDSEDRILLVERRRGAPGCNIP